MSQWQNLRELDTVYQQRVSDLYNRDEFPMDVRHYLAHWIEGQDWERASREPSLAVLLFQVLLENLDNQFSRFAQDRESFLLQRNFRRYKQNFQMYQEEPYNLAVIIHWFLTKEKEILNDADLAQKVQTLQVQPAPMEMESQRKIEKKVKELKQKAEVMEHYIRCLEEQQDEFDFKYQTNKMDSGPAEEKNVQDQVLQKMLNALDKSRRKFLADVSTMMSSANCLCSLLVDEELVDWKRRQQISCIGAPDDTSLEQLERWFTQTIECMFQLLKFLQKLDELGGKMTYINDPISAQKTPLKEESEGLLTRLLKSAFVVESQPTISQGRGPLMLRTNSQFSVKVRFLYKVPELNHFMKVNVFIEKAAAKLKGFRRFNVLGTISKALNMTESLNGGMVADFRHLTLKDQKVGSGGKGISDLLLSVTEELHKIHFETQFDYQGLSVSLETSSLPFVVISNSSQQQSAWASVLWFNMLCSDPKNLNFFESSPVATWAQFGEMLSWQFVSCGNRGLDSDQLETLAIKLFDKQSSYDNCTISWARFSKENIPGTNFSLWVWLDGVLNLVKTYLSDLWSDGSIMGFVSKGKEKVLLKKKQHGTFLLRFSESIRDGGITFSWVEYSNNGTPNVRAVQPFTGTDLKQIALPNIIRNFQIMQAENIPVNPLCYLYPNTHKDQAFGKYYSEETGDEIPYLKYLRTKLVFVSEEKGCTNSREEPVSDPQLSDSPCSEVDSDDMPPPSENSPMFSSFSNNADLVNSILEDNLSSVAETVSHFSSSFLQDPPPQINVEDLFPEALSPDTDDNDALRNFLNGPNMLNEVNSRFLQDEQGFFLDHFVEEIGYSLSNPLTP
ncbi:signal transducer and activator of transcription 2 [Triplophysa dalaica]|uniref:signal transducer and activator of transcription 2 n=1 Tax=Triplophysa dalaica TaxID=1582913 RepID=UPI0024E04134|nr:signal transducer and activator of transcription 2 [Triplophysa dalaica]